MTTADNQLDEQTQNRVLARVRKMMALANDAAASEGERDNALRMAHATLAKYNLSMAAAEAAGQTPEEKRLGVPMESRSWDAWERRVAKSVAELFFCRYFYTLGNWDGIRIKHMFIGKESNIYTAQEMAKYVIKSINTEAMRRAKAETGNPKGTFWRDFCKGAAQRIGERCHELLAAAEKSTERAPGTALVLASVYQSEKIANDHHLTVVMRVRLGRGAATRSPSTGGYGAGREFGGRVSLNRQVGSSTTGTKAPRLK